MSRFFFAIAVTPTGPATPAVAPSSAQHPHHLQARATRLPGPLHDHPQLAHHGLRGQIVLSRGGNNPAQLGAAGDDPRVRRACEHLFDYAPAQHGGLSASGLNSGLIHCLQGNLGAALLDFGYLGDARLDRALDWLARSITGEGIAPNTEKKAPVHYLRSGNSGPGFTCSANDHQPCAWGAVKALLALSKVPGAQRPPTMARAVEAGAAFLLSRDPAAADYPMGYATKPNRSWFKLGYPIGYVTDALQNLEVLVALGYGADPRLANGLALVLSKQDDQGRWPLEYTYNGKTWVDVGARGQPSKWVTLRALRVLHGADRQKAGLAPT